MKVRFDDALIRYLILNGKDNDTILNKLSSLNFIKNKSQFDFFLERIFRIRKDACFEIACDMLGHGFSKDYVFRELHPISRFLPKLVIDSAVKDALNFTHKWKPKTSIKDLELMVKLLSKNGFFIFLESYKYFISLKIYGDRTFPAYYDLTISIEKYNNNQRSFIINFLKKLTGKNVRFFTKNLIEALERFGDSYAKLDVLSIVMSYIEEDAVKLSIKGLSKSDIISQLRKKYSDILNHVIETQSTISPIDRELRRLNASKKFLNSLIHGSVFQISRSRIRIETPKIILPHFSLEITLIQWSKRSRNLILKLLNAIGNKDLVQFQCYLENWLRRENK